MADPTEGLHKNITLNDVQLASAYYSLLVDMARDKQCLTYSELIAAAKKVHPNNNAVKKAIAASIGRKLDVVRLFTSEHGLPDLTCLIINKDQGECEVGVTPHFDPEETRSKVFDFDWSNISPDFDGYIKHNKKAITPRKKKKRQEAVDLMSAYYFTHKSSLPASIKKKREEIIKLLEEGLSEEEAFTQAMNAT